MIGWGIPKMKLFSAHAGRRRTRGGFSLVEATLSIGIMSFGLLTLVPLLALGMKTSRFARDDRTTAQIAQTLVQEAEQGTLVPGTLYYDETGAACTAPQAAFTAQPAIAPFQASLSQVTLRVTPIGAPDRARIYAVVFQPPQ
jgi:Tfp pilus assembly protein PilV